MSDKKYHNNNRKIITKLLLRNKYPSEFINKQIKARLKKIYHSENSQEAPKNNNNQISTATICMPNCKNFHRVSKLFKDYNVRIIPSLCRCLQSIILRSKDKSNILDQTNVVYRFNCKQCPAVYVGQTKRALDVRKHEHENNKSHDFVMNVHKNKYNHMFDWKNPDILDFEQHWFKRSIF